MLGGFKGVWGFWGFWGIRSLGCRGRAKRLGSQVAVEELKSSYSNEETPFFAMYPSYGNLIQLP